MSIKTLWTAAAWSLVVALGGTTVATLSAQAIAQNSEQKVAPALDSKGKSAILSNNPVYAGEMLAHTCAACHGTLGQLGDESFMPLAGMPTDQFVNTMVAFREGKRPSTLMGHVARGFSDAELRAMAAFFAAQHTQSPERGAL